MSGLLSVGTRALQANQVALQTAGNNIANVNTPGYSRQRVLQQTVEGQFTGSGYIGKGMEVQTIQRNFSAFLTRQSTLAGTTAAADMTRSDKLKQLEGIFEGGASGLGAAVSDMLNAFSDVASAPTDLTARTVVLTRVDETAARMRASSLRLDDLQQNVAQELSQKVNTINSLAQNIAKVNGEIAKAQGSGQPPNDLLDRRDQMVRELNQHVQTTSITADDGTLGIFIGGSQALVLSTTASSLSIVKDEFGDPLKSKLAISQGGQFTTLDENTLGGGEVSGLLRFQNTDLVEGRNLLGRLTLAITTAMNDQHKLGVDMNGNVGGNLFTPTTFGAKNILQPTGQASAASLSLRIADTSKFVASDYELTFSTDTAGSITRKSDNFKRDFTFTPGTLGTPGTFAFGNPAVDTMDGLALSATAGNPAAGERFLIKPFSTSASDIRSEFSSPRALAVSNPVAASMSPANKGSLALASLSARTVASTAAAPLDNFSINFTVAAGVTTYAIVDNTTATTVVAAGQPYVSGQAINYTPAGAPGFSLTLTGIPSNADTMTIQQNAYPTLSGGNASAMMGLRDVAMFDGAVLTDGYAGLIAQVGTRVQGADYAATISSAIASNLERDRTSVSGVNLDEEAAKLLQYQQAYQAAAKMIQIAQSIFDTLIQTLGR